MFHSLGGSAEQLERLCEILFFFPFHIIMPGCSSIKEKGKKGGTHQPFYGTWVVDFRLKQDAGSFILG